MKIKDVAAIILAAGLGKRMKSDTPKVLHPVAGRPMLFYPVQVIKNLGLKKAIIIVGHKAEKVMEILDSELRTPNSELKFVKQEPQLGTGHAVLCAENVLKAWKGDILILSGDVPLITKQTILGLLDLHAKKKAAISFISTVIADPSGYGRVLRDENNSVKRIVEDKDSSIEEKAINEINTGIYCINAQFLFSGLKNIKRENAQGEYYLPDLIEIAAKAKQKVACLTHINPAEVMGINNRIELAQANGVMRERINNELMLSGVSLIDPETTYIHYGVKIGKDTTIYPNVFLESNTNIGKGCLIEQGCMIQNSHIGDGSKIKSNSVIESSEIGGQVSIGPFARIRPDSTIGDGARIGNFVEVKKSRIGRGTKANHLSYLGDAIIGSDTQLIAPVKVGKNAYIGSGSTITKNVPPGSLALSRIEQRVVEGWALKRRKRKE